MLLILLKRIIFNSHFLPKTSKILLSIAKLIKKTLKHKNIILILQEITEKIIFGNLWQENSEQVFL